MGRGRTLALPAAGGLWRSPPRAGPGPRGAPHPRALPRRAPRGPARQPPDGQAVPRWRRAPGGPAPQPPGGQAVLRQAEWGGPSTPPLAVEVNLGQQRRVPAGFGASDSCACGRASGRLWPATMRLSPAARLRWSVLGRRRFGRPSGAARFFFGIRVGAHADGQCPAPSHASPHWAARRPGASAGGLGGPFRRFHSSYSGSGGALGRYFEGGEAACPAAPAGAGGAQPLAEGGKGSPAAAVPPGGGPGGGAPPPLLGPA